MPLPKFITNILTGSGSKLIETISNTVDEFTLSKEEKEAIKLKLIEEANKHTQLMEVELTKQMESEDESITSRWKSDMESDSWLSKNTRPLVMLSLLAALFLMIAFDSALKDSFEIKDSYITLMETLLVTVTIAYFGSRGVEKFKTIHEVTKRK